MSRAKATQIPGGALPTTAAPVAADAETASLPNAVDVDPRALRGPVLTRQGYVCPDEAWQKANPTEFQALLKA